MTVAKSISLKDKFENLGARYAYSTSFFSRFFRLSFCNSLVQDVAQKTIEIAGDGTTTATVLARAIFSEVVKNVAAGCNPMDLRRGSQKAVDHVISVLEKKKRVITTSEEISQVR